MLSLPTKGVAVSLTNHNVDRSIVCDWIEASCVFSGNAVSGSDIVDILLEDNIYKDQDYAWELVSDCLSDLNVRKRLIGDGYPLVVSDEGVEVKGEWEDYAPYAFCLMLSLAKSHGVWVRENFDSNYTVQGDLFELLTAEAVPISLSGWQVRQTGWTPNRPASIAQVVRDVCGYLNEAAGDVFRWTAATAKEAGLDLVSWRPYPDGNVGVPVYLWQCASGMDWEKKRKTPDIDVWSRLVNWAVTPKRAMSMPYALSESGLRIHSLAVQGLLLDRHRLLEPGRRNRDWVSAQLRDQLIDWLWPRAALLPMSDDKL